MAGVTLTKAFVTTDTTKMYTNAIATWSEGINAPAGVYDSLILRGSVTSAADPAASDVGNLLTAIRIVINGEVTFDWRQPTPAHSGLISSIKLEVVHTRLQQQLQRQESSIGRFQQVALTMEMLCELKQSWNGVRRLKQSLPVP